MVHSSITLKIHSAFVMLARNVAKNLKGKSKSSQEWIIRQLADPYVELAKTKNYRCRSVFKLLSIDDRFKIFSPGQCVIDCGAAPGSWTQVAVDRTNADGEDFNLPVGTVIAVDKSNIAPIKGALIFGLSDFTQSNTHLKIQSALNGKTVNGVLSDMAPNATGIQSMDHENIIKLAYHALRFAVQVSSKGAWLVIKIWSGVDQSRLENDLRTFYNSVKVVKPEASRSDSAEIFLLAREFKGLRS